MFFFVSPPKRFLRSCHFQTVYWPAFNLLQLSRRHFCTFTPIIQHPAVIYSRHSLKESLLKRIWKTRLLGLLLQCQTAVGLLVRMQPVSTWYICDGGRGNSLSLLSSWWPDRSLHPALGFPFKVLLPTSGHQGCQFWTKGPFLFISASLPRPGQGGWRPLVLHPAVPCREYENEDERTISSKYLTINWCDTSSLDLIAPGVCIPGVGVPWNSTLEFTLLSSNILPSKSGEITTNR